MEKLNSDVHVILLDIDGTIKDLVKENTDALIRTMEAMGRVDSKLRGKFVLFINRIMMTFVKCGLLPTNGIMQGMLLLVYSILLLKKHTEFKKTYFAIYNSINIFFENVDKEIKYVFDNNIDVYLVTKNSQNKSVLDCSFLKGVTDFVTGGKEFKYYTYRNLVKKLGNSKESIVIIGDNFWDDVLPALILGVKVVWINRYDSKIKKYAIKLITSISKRILTGDNIYS